ncbi:unnamed protein product, partial [Mesorhabditis belari]|uniref:Piezo TM1-24 domain-containing protein n=1 Tax=Mesorhabditis belari TaxID=2138241 RepID=A0AAF3EXU4_9BILA
MIESKSSNKSEIFNPLLSIKKFFRFLLHEILGENFKITDLLQKIVAFARAQAYVLTLFIMMAWSLTFHSWLTFALLAASCVVWMSPNPQQFCFKVAPIVALYATFLLGLQFVYSLNLTQKELPDENPPYLRQFGMEKPRDRAPFADLCLKCLFTSIIFLSIKQKIVELKKKSKEDEMMLESESTMIEKIRKFLADHWVLFTMFLILLISLQAPVVLYRLLYMAFFQTFLVLFQISFPTWRRGLYAFWMSMIIYCMAVVTLIYTFQFHGVPDFYARYLSNDVIHSFGLERISSGQLLIKLLTPISFLIFSLIQVNFFHERLMSRTEKWEQIIFDKKPQLSRIFAELHAQSEMRMDFFRQHFAMVQSLM